ncbi:hypothetical protein K501DRAFT_268091 [Backusella circina FSU 941]|nr:hypothetical protein K501DRAFT_268091 [Backusella circina FSU 941]
MPKITNVERNLYNKVNNHKKNLHKYDLDLKFHKVGTFEDNQSYLSSADISQGALERGEYKNEHTMSRNALFVGAFGLSGRHYLISLNSKPNLIWSFRVWYIVLDWFIVPKSAKKNL